MRMKNALMVIPALAGLILAGCETKDSGPGPKQGAALPAVPKGLPAPAIPAGNPMTAEKVELGKLLYFDKRLSKDGTISCATCHDPKIGWAEREATSKGIGNQVGGRNAPTVINAAYMSVMFWDGRMKTLEEQALGPIENPIEMGQKMELVVADLAKVAEYQKRFQQVFGTGITKEGVAKAIAAFERTILSGNSPYDKFTAGDKAALNDIQKKGMDLFMNGGCNDCHAAPIFSNSGYYNAGVGMDKPEPDEGRKKATSQDSDLGKFRVPHLREIAKTGPYFHNGSAKTLEEAVDLMASGGKDNPKLSGMFKDLKAKNLGAEDKKALVEFLKALSGEFPILEAPKPAQ